MYLRSDNTSMDCEKYDVLHGKSHRQMTSIQLLKLCKTHEEKAMSNEHVPHLTLYHWTYNYSYLLTKQVDP